MSTSKADATDGASADLADAAVPTADEDYTGAAVPTAAAVAKDAGVETTHNESATKPPEEAKANDDDDPSAAENDFGEGESLSQLKDSSTAPQIDEMGKPEAKDDDGPSAEDNDVGEGEYLSQLKESTTAAQIAEMGNPEDDNPSAAGKDDGAGECVSQPKESSTTALVAEMGQPGATRRRDPEAETANEDRGGECAPDHVKKRQRTQKKPRPPPLPAWLRPPPAPLPPAEPGTEAHKTIAKAAERLESLPERSSALKYVWELYWHMLWSAPRRGAPPPLARPPPPPPPAAPHAIRWPKFPAMPVGVCPPPPPRVGWGAPPPPPVPRPPIIDPRGPDVPPGGVPPGGAPPPNPQPPLPAASSVPPSPPAAGSGTDSAKGTTKGKKSPKKKSWEQRYVEYVLRTDDDEQNKESSPAPAPAAPTGRRRRKKSGLDRWVTRQRQLYARQTASRDAAAVPSCKEKDEDGKGEAAPEPSLDAGSDDDELTPERIRALNRVGFVWDPNDLLWNRRYEELLRYKEENGHTNVPASQGALGRWVQTHRRNNRHGLARKSADGGDANAAATPTRGRPILREDRKAKLDAIGFEWGPPDATQDFLDERWEKMFQSLCDYKRNHGHTNVPQLEGELGRWVKTQRNKRALLMKVRDGSLGPKERKFRIGPLREDREAQLDSIGFDWTPFKGSTMSWSERLEQLREYRDRYGNCDVPQKWRENVQLSYWVKKQRDRYKETLKGGPHEKNRPAFLSTEQMAALDEVGLSTTSGRFKRKDDPFISL